MTQIELINLGLERLHKLFDMLEKKNEKALLELTFKQIEYYGSFLRTNILYLPTNESNEND